MLLHICAPVAGLIVFGLAIKQAMAFVGVPHLSVYGSLYALATLWALGSPWIVVRARLKTYRYSRWLAFDEVAGAYGLALLTFIAVFMLYSMLFVR